MADIFLEPVTRTVETHESGWRLDLYLVHHFPKFSRMMIRKAIQSGLVQVDGRGGKTAYRLKTGQQVTLTPPEIPREAPQAENIPLDILHEDADLIVINKPAGMVVHPSRGHWSGTLVSALAWHFAGQLSSLRGPLRPGIVHRLDRDTSGAILVAKNDRVHGKLALLFQEGSIAPRSEGSIAPRNQQRIRKEYFAIAWGSPNLDRDVIDQPIGHHPKHREKMAILPCCGSQHGCSLPGGLQVALLPPEAKDAQTFYEVLERFRGMTTFRVLPKTGRTHQIRLHLTHLGCPILCDALYGRQSQITLSEIIAGRTAPFIEGQPGDPLLTRQALHAHRLTFEHPETGKTLEIVAPIPDDLRQTLEAIEKYRRLQ